MTAAKREFVDPAVYVMINNFVIAIRFGIINSVSIQF
jgi:hypothetical protein